MADGYVVIDTKVDESGLRKGLASLEKGIAVGVTAATTALSTLGAAVVNLGTEFEAQMSRVQAISGATADEMSALNEQAKKLGADTVFSASEAAEGMENLASAGFSVTEIMSSMPGMLDLAAVSGGDVANAADVAASTLRAFGIQGEETGKAAQHIADVFARAAADTNAEVNDMGYAMKYIAPVAHAMGISIEETAAAVGILSDAGIKGEQAGTTLRGALTRLAKPSETASILMKDLGLNFYDTATGKMLPLKEQVAMLQTKLKGLTDEEKQNALVTLYGQSSLSGMLALIDAGPEKLDSLTKNLENCDGAAAEMADTMMDNVKGALEDLSGSAETLGLSVYDGIKEPLKDAVKVVDGFVGELQEAFDEGGLDGLVSAFGNVLAEATEYIAGYAPKLIDLGVSLVNSFLEGIAQNADTIAGAAVDIGLSLVEGLSSISINLVRAGTEVVISLVNGITEAVPQLLEMVPELFGEVTALIDELLPEIASAGLKCIESLADSIKDNLPKIIKSIGDYAYKIVEIVPQLAKDIIEALPDVIDSISSAIKSSLPVLLEAASEIVLSLVEQLPELCQSIIGIIPDILGSIVDIIATLLPMLTECLVGIIEELAVQLPELIVSIMDMLPEVLNSIVEVVTTLLPMLIECAMELVNSLVEQLPSIINQIVMALPELIHGIVEGLLGLLPELVDCGVELFTSLVRELPQIIYAITAVLPTIIASVVETITSLMPLIIECGLELLTSLVKALPQIIITITAVLPQIISSIISALLDDLPLLIQCGIDLLTSLIEDLPTIIATIVMYLPQIIASIVDALIDNIPQIIAAGVQLLTSLVKAIPDCISALKNSLPQIITAIVNGLRDGINKVKEIGKNIVSGLWNGISDKTSWLVGKIKSFCSNALGAIKNFFGIHSPSTLMRDIVGKNLMLGWGDGITENADEVTSSFAEVGQELLDTDFNYEPEDIPLKDLSATASVKYLEQVIEADKSRTDSTVRSAPRGYTYSESDNSNGGGSNDNKPKYVDVHLDIDGKEFARTEAPYLEKELDWRRK